MRRADSTTDSIPDTQLLATVKQGISFGSPIRFAITRAELGALAKPSPTTTPSILLSGRLVLLMMSSATIFPR